MHKLLGLCIYDPESKANIISKTQAWASGWLWYTVNDNKSVYMTNPDHPKYKYTFEVNKENIIVGMDAESFDTFAFRLFNVSSHSSVTWNYKCNQTKHFMINNLKIEFKL